MEYMEFFVLFCAMGISLCLFFTIRCLMDIAEISVMIEKNKRLAKEIAEMMKKVELMIDEEKQIQQPKNNP